MSDDQDLDATAPKRRRAVKRDSVAPAAAEAKGKCLQSHGRNSVVYVPVILKLFQDRWRPGAATVVFSLDDVRTAVEAVRAASDVPDRISSRNPSDVVYRMRSRTKLPQEILDKGFPIVRRQQIEADYRAAKLAGDPLATQHYVGALTALLQAQFGAPTAELTPGLGTPDSRSG